MWQPVAAARGRTPNAWWRTLVAALAVVVVVIGFIAVAGALSSADTSFVVAQLISRDEQESGQPKLVATGFGRASAPAETATLQLVITPAGDQFNGSGFQPTPEASPEPGETAIAVPIIDAIVGEGVSRGAISVIVSPIYGTSSFYGGGASTGFRLDIRLPNPSAELVETLMSAAYRAASENGLYVAAQGVVYGAGDCDALEQEARASAIADGRRQAEQQAAALDANLGTLLEVADAPPGTTDLASCAATASGHDRALVNNPYAFNPGGLALDAAAYDPAQPPEAVVEFRVELTYTLPTTNAKTGR